MSVDDLDDFFFVEFLQVFIELAVGKFRKHSSESHPKEEFSADVFCPFYMIAFEELCVESLVGKRVFSNRAAVGRAE